MSQSRQLAAIMFTDIVGYTTLMGKDEQKAFELLKKNRSVQRPIIEKFNGRWLKEIGDGVLASFTTTISEAHTALGRAYFFQNQVIKAFTYYQKGLEKDDVNLDGGEYYWIANAFGSIGDYEKAEAYSQMTAKFACL